MSVPVHGYVGERVKGQAQASRRDDLVHPVALGAEPAEAEGGRRGDDRAKQPQLRARLWRGSHSPRSHGKLGCG